VDTSSYQNSGNLRIFPSISPLLSHYFFSCMPAHSVQKVNFIGSITLAPTKFTTTFMEYRKRTTYANFIKRIQAHVFHPAGQYSLHCRTGGSLRRLQE